MEVSTTPVELMNYEQAFDELEQIVNTLETSQASLNDAITLYERGKMLAKHCEDLLEKAELQIRQLNDEEDIEP